MGLIYHLKGNNLIAKRGEGGISASALGAIPAVVNSDQAGFGGDDTIDMSGAASGVRPLVYPGGNNVPQTGHMTMLVSVYFDDVALNQGLFKIGMGGRTPVLGWNMYLTSANQLRLYYYDSDGLSDAMFSSVSIATTGVWYDFVWQYPKDPTLGGNKLWVNGVINKTQNSTKTITPAFVQEFINAFMVQVGYVSDSYDNARFHLREIGIWDDLIDPTDVALTTGQGSLDGPARTAYLDSTTFDGANNTWPADTLVINGTTWYEEGVLGTGSLALPAVGLVKTGTVYGGLTGTRDDAPIASVLVGTSYGEDGTELDGTVIQPIAAEVQVGVVFGPSGSLVGTYTGASKVFQATGFTDLPRVEGAMANWMQDMVFTVITKTDVNYEVVETREDNNFRGVIYPSTTSELMKKPEGQRAWKWYTVIAEPTVNLALDSDITYKGQNFRVKDKSDYKEYGFIQYGLVEDWTEA